MIASSRPTALSGGRRLGAFITASIAVHGLLLGAWIRDDSVLPPATELMVTMITTDRSSPAPTAHAKSTVAREHDHAPVKHVVRPRKAAPVTKPENPAVNRMATTAMTENQQQPLPQDDVRKTPQTSNSDADTTGTTKVETAGKLIFSLGQLKERADKQLHSDFARHFYYPYLAQRRNWQGEVRLGLRIEASGRLSHIHIVKSSGYAVLDQAALDSLKKVASIPDAGHWLRGNSFDTVLPVEYRLIDS